MQTLKTRRLKLKTTKKKTKLLHVVDGFSQALQCKDPISMNTKDRIQRAEWVSG
jgi:hypothetical protein